MKASLSHCHSSLHMVSVKFMRGYNKTSFSVNNSFFVKIYAPIAIRNASAASVYAWMLLSNAWSIKLATFSAYNANCIVKGLDVGTGVQTAALCKQLQTATDADNPIKSHAKREFYLK